MFCFLYVRLQVNQLTTFCFIRFMHHLFTWYQKFMTSLWICKRRLAKGLFFVCSRVVFWLISRFRFIWSWIYLLVYKLYWEKDVNIFSVFAIWQVCYGWIFAHCVLLCIQQTTAFFVDKYVRNCFANFKNNDLAK